MWRKFFIILIILSALGGLEILADSLRGNLAAEVTVTIKSGAEHSFQAFSDEIVIVRLADKADFLQALQLELVIPEDIKRYSDSFMVAVYSNISPQPKIGMNVLTATKLFSAVLPHTSRTFIRIPMKGKTDLESSAPGILGITRSVTPDDFPLAIVLQSVMKGLPESLFLQKFSMTMRPELEKKGKVTLRISKPDNLTGEGVYVTIDGKVYAEKDFPVVLSAGFHELTVDSELFKKATLSFSLLSGEDKVLDLALEASVTSISFNVATSEETVVFWDGKKLDVYNGMVMEIEPGEHTLRIKIGDYSLTRKIIAKRGKNYLITLSLEILIKED